VPRSFAPSRHWFRWINLAALVRVIAVLVTLQIAAIVPAMASVAALLNDDASNHCACCKGNEAQEEVTEIGVMALQADDEDCGGCPTGLPCTDCPAGCASCHSASSARVLLPSAFSVVLFFSEGFDSGAIAEHQAPRGPFLSSLDRPPKLPLAV